MAFKQTLSITMTDCCETVQLCDTTCVPSPFNATECIDGYSVAGNINKWDVIETRINIKFPDGNEITGFDPGYVPNNKAYGSTTITAGNSGTVQVSIAGYGILGVTSYDTSLAVTASNLVSAINSNSGNSGWSAFIDSSTTNKLWFYNSNGDGLAANGAAITTTVTGTMTMTATATTAGGTDADDCITFTLADVWAYNNDIVLNNNAGPSWADGVYEFTMVSYDANRLTELGSVTEKILFTCVATSCLKESLLSSEGCGCDSDYDQRILKTRLKIEQAEHQFNEGLYDCAQETIIKAGKMCGEVCLDC